MRRVTRCHPRRVFVLRRWPAVGESSGGQQHADDLGPLCSDLLDVRRCFRHCSGRLDLFCHPVSAQARFPEPHPTHGNTKLEITWTIMPALILAVITVRLSPDCQLREEAGCRYRYRPGRWSSMVVGVRLSRQKVVDADEMHVPVGTSQRCSCVVTMSFTASGCRSSPASRMLLPNQDNHLWFTPTRSAPIRGQCAEFCGTQHANMALHRLVSRKRDFDAWLTHQKLPRGHYAEQRSTRRAGQEVFFTARLRWLSYDHGRGTERVQALDRRARI